MATTVTIVNNSIIGFRLHTAGGLRYITAYVYNTAGAHAHAVTIPLVKDSDDSKPLTDSWHDL